MGSINEISIKSVPSLDVAHVELTDGTLLSWELIRSGLRLVNMETMQFGCWVCIG